MVLNNIDYKLLETGFLIYKITNTINNKCYIGLTKNLVNRIWEHKKCSSGKHKINCYIHKAINKYGEANFRLDVIEKCTEFNVHEKEKFYIKLYKSNNCTFGYNLTTGGENPTDNMEVTLRRRLANKTMVSVASYDLNGILLKTFISVKECSRFYSINDSDIHRCCRKNWTRLNLQFKKFEGEPINKIPPYISKKSARISASQLGRIPLNRVRCKAVNLKTGDIYTSISLLDLAIQIDIHRSTIFKIFNNKKHKKWLILKEVN